MSLTRRRWAAGIVEVVLCAVPKARTVPARD
jgi:hypothetical protein